MSTRHTSRVIRTAILLGGGLLLWTATSGALRGGDGLRARTRAFLQSIRISIATSEYFPSTGELTYVHTRHAADGDHVEVSRFSAAQVAQQLASGGPLFEAVHPSPEGEVVGLLVNQAACRGVEWVRKAGTRFVPPGEDESSRAFIEWRRESRRWVISSFGDESFDDGRMPDWVCS